jgi:aubergine-like protein
MYPYNCNRGSAKPTYYKVVYSDSEMQEGILQELIYLQCFNYANWSGSIKVPGPMQYARKLATFMSQNIGKEGHGQEMTDKLYYI